jgi:hypothetical protein
MPATEASTNASRERFDFIGGILPSRSVMRSPTERGPYLFRNIRRFGTSRQPRERYPMVVSRNNKRAARRNRLAPRLVQRRAEPLRGYPHPAAHGRPPSPARERELWKLALSSQPHLGESSSHPFIRDARALRAQGPRGVALSGSVYFFAASPSTPATTPLAKKSTRGARLDSRRRQARCVSRRRHPQRTRRTAQQTRAAPRPAPRHKAPPPVTSFHPETLATSGPGAARGGALRERIFFRRSGSESQQPLPLRKNLPEERAGTYAVGRRAASPGGATRAAHSGRASPRTSSPIPTSTTSSGPLPSDGPAPRNKATARSPPARCPRARLDRRCSRRRRCARRSSEDARRA